MNMELDNLLYNDREFLDSEEFRDKVFSYIENLVLKGYPIFRLFYLPEKLKKYYEDELKQNIYKNDKKRFAKYKCFKCKHYCDKINVYVGDPGMNIMGNNKNQLVVAAIENGTVIDHIPAKYAIYKILRQVNLKIRKIIKK